MKLKEFYQITKEELEQLHGAEPLDFRLEQVEYDQVSSSWRVVVSYLVEKKYTSPLEEKMNIFPKHERVYKALEIDKNNEVIGFRIFEAS